MTDRDSGASILVRRPSSRRTISASPSLPKGSRTPRPSASWPCFGCDLVQGFHVARPMPAPELAGWLAHADVVEPAS